MLLRNQKLIHKINQNRAVKSIIMKTVIMFTKTVIMFTHKGFDTTQKQLSRVEGPLDRQQRSVYVFRNISVSVQTILATLLRKSPNTCRIACIYSPTSKPTTTPNIVLYVHGEYVL